MELELPLKRIHFVGIGGIGMSAIAEILQDFGYTVQGSDGVENPNVIRLRKRGIKVFIGHHVRNLKKVDAVVVSSAIKPSNVEYRAAQKLGLPIGHRAEMLAEILRYKQGICISGTHGKTTTSSLITSILLKAKLKPSFVIGGILNSHATNAASGDGPQIVVEADESDGSFLKLPRFVSVVTNIDPEHMDYYKTFDMVKKAYEMFIQNTSFYGFTVACVDHPVVREVVDQIKNRKIIGYGLDKKASVHADRIRYTDKGMTFDVFVKVKNKFRKITDVQIAMFGLHNVRNALAAIAVGVELGIKDSIIKKALAGFKGIQRRLTIRGTVKGVRIFDDYGHHPVEIQATLEAVEAAKTGKVIAVFEPHRYSRFRDLWDDFLTSFDKADTVVVCPVYSGGENAIEGINASRFADELRMHHRRVIELTDWSELVRVVHQETSGKDSVVCLGAGSISSRSIKLVKELKKVKK